MRCPEVSEDFTFFFGCASGSSKAALKRAEEPNVMINFCTHNNKPWLGIENLFIDSGGYSFLKNKGEYNRTNREYINYVYTYSPNYFSLRDYPCEKDLLTDLNRNVKDHQKKTNEKHRELLELFESWGKNVESQPVSVIQGQTIDDYLRHYDQLKENGLLTDYCAIGSLCGRKKVEEIRQIVIKLKQEIPNRIKLHGFGIKKSSLKYKSVLKSLDSADSNAWDVGGSSIPQIDGRVSGGKRKSWLDSMHGYIHLKRDVNNYKNQDNNQQTISQFNKV